MKNSFMLPLVMAGQLVAGPALAQGSGEAVTILRMAGPQLGVALEEVDKDVVARLKLREEKGALVTEVLENSAAEKAGIKAGDLLIKLGDTSVAETSDLQEAVRALEPGKATPLTVWRDGRNVDLTVTIEAERRTKIEAPRSRRPIF